MIRHSQYEHVKNIKQLLSVYAALRFATSDSKLTMIKYNVAIAHLEEVLGRPALLNDLNDETITAMMGKLIRAGRTPQTANGCRAKLLALWRFALNKGLVRFGPEVQKIPEPKREPVAWDAEQLRTLFHSFEGLTGWVGPVRAPDFWRLLHLVMWETAERVTAIMALRWEDWDCSGRWLTVRAETTKTKKRDRSFQLHPDTAKGLDEIRYPTRERIFEFDGCPGTLWFQYRKILQRAGLPSDSKHMFHAMRRSVASHLEAAGINSTDYLDHSSRSITVDSYISPIVAPKTQISELLFRPDRRKSESGKRGAR